MHAVPAAIPEKLSFGNGWRRGAAGLAIARSLRKRRAWREKKDRLSPSSNVAPSMA